MGNPYTPRAIQKAKGLRELVIRMNEHDRVEKAKEDEEEEQIRAKKASTDYPANQLEKFVKEESEEVADWEPEDGNEEILFLVDRILYKLMSYEDDTWKSEDDFEERNQLKLKEILQKPSMRVYKRRFSY